MSDGNPAGELMRLVNGYQVSQAIHVAATLGIAELFRGDGLPFAGGVRGAFMAVSGDPHGTMVEAYPDGIALEPDEGDGEVRFVDAGKTGAPGANLPGPSMPTSRSRASARRSNGPERARGGAPSSSSGARPASHRPSM